MYTSSLKVTTGTIVKIITLNQLSDQVKKYIYIINTYSVILLPSGGKLFSIKNNKLYLLISKVLNKPPANFLAQFKEPTSMKIGPPITTSRPRGDS